MSVRLSTLEPLFIGYVRQAGLPDRFGLGFSFLCPICRKSRISILFENPADGGPPAAWITPARYYRTGSHGVTDLTVRQEIDATGRCQDGCPGFRGKLQNGDAVPRAEARA